MGELELQAFLWCAGGILALLAAIVSFFFYRKKKINDYVFVFLLFAGIIIFVICIFRGLALGAIVTRPKFD